MVFWPCFAMLLYIVKVGGVVVSYFRACSDFDCGRLAAVVVGPFDVSWVDDSVVGDHHGDVAFVRE